MTSSKYLIAGIVLLIIVVLVGTVTAYANIDYAQEGTDKVVTYFAFAVIAFNHGNAIQTPPASRTLSYTDER